MDRHDFALEHQNPQFSPRSALPFFFFFKILFYFIFLEKGREEEKERNIKVWLPFTGPLLGTWPTTQAWTLTGNRTGDSLVHSPAINPLSHSIQGYFHFLFIVLLFAWFCCCVCVLTVLLVGVKNQVHENGVKKWRVD